MDFQQDAADFQHGDDRFVFITTPALVRKADPKAPEGGPWKDGADQWRIVLEEPGYGGQVEVEFWTGIGCRGLQGDVLVPVAPSAATFLYSVGSDVLTALDMPADDADALDYLTDEFGGLGDKPSDGLRMVRSLRAIRAKIEHLLRNTGITPREFAEWASELDA